ncbi:MAG: PqqD family peptide modification chaperone [Phycisphaerae bacterium]|nr:PqqD family peptide modification chaperone [Phycisphaerae bacterium]
MERPTFSPFWHRVQHLRPRLRPHVEVTRQHYRGRRWHVVHDPSSNQFYRLSPVAYDLVSTLDGARTVEEAWQISLSKFGDGAPTQNEIIELLSQLYNTNLLAIDQSPETEQLLRRGRERTARRLKQQAIGLMYFRFKLFNPNRILNALEPFFRPLINRWGLLAWCLFVGWTIALLLPHLPRLATGLDQYLLDMNPADWGWLLAVFVATKLFHELGHGIICKRFGGQVPEFGVMLLVLLPSPYVDASASWAFPSKWQRCAVGAGGMLFELALAAIAAHVWLNAADGTLAHRLAYYVMIGSSIATLLFNANPLMRFDGYFMLADILETPNLMQRSTQMLNHLFQKHVLRLKNLRPPSTLPSEQVILVVYGALSAVYRVVLFFTITLYILGQFFIIGVLLACWSAAAWFLLPMGKLAHWLATSSSLAEHRPRTIAVTLACIAAVLLLIGAVPLPDWRRGGGVVESAAHTGVFFATDGFVETALVRPGDRVVKDQVLARLVNPDLHRARATLIAQEQDARVRRDEARAGNEAGTVDLLTRQIAVLADQRAEIERRIAALTLRAPHDGTIVAGDPQLAVGAFVRRGEPLCQVVDLSRLRVAATLRQGEGAWFNELRRDDYAVAMRFASRIPTIVAGGRVWSPQAAQLNLPHPALGPRGGGDIEIDPEDRDGRIARRGIFTVYVEPEPNPDAPTEPIGLPGERVWLRFTLPSKPILAQVVDRLQKLIQGRVNL